MVGLSNWKNGASFSKIGRLPKNGRVGEVRDQRYIVEQTKLF